MQPRSAPKARRWSKRTELFTGTLRAAPGFAVMRLVIGNKCYSSWSLRPWLAMSALDIDFEERLIPFGEPGFKDAVTELSGAGLVPVLIDGEVTVWESLAIIEYLADRFPNAGVWPSDPAARAHARSISAEMHAGFAALRGACPMNLGKRFTRRERGADVARDVDRAVALWREARDRFADPAAGPFLYGAFTGADAMYAPVVARLDTYAIDLPAEVRPYVDAILSHAAFVEWREAALKEPWIELQDEIDEPALENLRPGVSA